MGVCGVVGGKVNNSSFDVSNTLAGSHTEHAWSSSETRKNKVKITHYKCQLIIYKSMKAIILC